MSAVGQVAQSGVAPEDYRAVIGSFASGVTIVTTVGDNFESLGTTVSAISSVCLEPPTLLACLNTGSATGQAIARSGHFAVNVLAEHQAGLARRFATKRTGKFEGVKVVPGADGLPLLDEVIAHVTCRVVERLASGTHLVFLGRVITAAAVEGRPLAHFRGRFRRLEPAEAAEPGSYPDSAPARRAQCGRTRAA